MTPRTSLGQQSQLSLAQVPEPIPILYVDDDANDVLLLQRQLGEGVQNPIRCFTDPQAFFDYLDQNKGPFIILVDLVLPNWGIGGGYEVLTRLRERPDIVESRSSVIAVTGTLIDQDMIERTTDAGAHGCLPKPVSVANIGEIIGKPGWFRVNFTL